MTNTEKIRKLKLGCYYCAYLNRCATAEHRDGQTCDLFWLDKEKK